MIHRVEHSQGVYAREVRDQRGIHLHRGDLQGPLELEHVLIFPAIHVANTFVWQVDAQLLDARAFHEYGPEVFDTVWPA